MSFRYRKTYRSGPFRMTISKRGIGYSLGGKRARITHRADGRSQSTAHIAPGLSYTSTSHKHRTKTRRASSTTKSRVTDTVPSAATQRADLATSIQHHIETITSYHHRAYAEVTGPIVVPPTSVNAVEVSKRMVKDSTRRFKRWEFSKRRKAKAEALSAVPARIAQLEVESTAENTRLVEKAQARWEGLVRNDPSVVQAAIREAFADYEVPTFVTVGQDEKAAICIIYPSLEIIPEQKATTTGAGRLTVAKRSQTERNEVYLEAVSSLVVDASKRALAASPRLDQIGVAVFRATGASKGAATSVGLPEPILYAEFPSADVRTFTALTNALQAVRDHAIEGFQIHGRTHEVESLGSFHGPYASLILEAERGGFDSGAAHGKGEPSK